MTHSAEALARSLASRYRIERELGQGGMATVYLAEDLKHDRKVAIKVLKPELAAVLGADRFVVEIKTTAALSHPHILPLFDSGTADGFLFYVMPFIEGETIREKLTRESQFGVDEAVRIAREVADALDYAHRHGVIHRDIKPENIMLHDGRAMVMDFGIALAVSAAAGGRMTETGLSLGTPHYMSPEQATAEKEITPRSDIYSLASVLYEMLAGQPPHIGGAAQQVIMKIITAPALPVTALRKSVPANVVVAIATALEKLPADRFESAAKFADALANASYTNAAVEGAAWAAANGTRDIKRTLIAVSIVAAVATGAAAILTPDALKWRRAQSAAAPPMRFAIQAPPGYRLVDADPALSRDGRLLVFIADSSGNSRLFVRELQSVRPTPIAGTEGASAARVLLSPDGAWVIYQKGLRLVRARIDESQPPQVIARLPQLSFLATESYDWADDGSLFLIPDPAGAILRMDFASERIDTIRAANPDSGDQLISYPAVLPGSHALLFGRMSGAAWSLVARRLDGSRDVVLVPGAPSGRMVGPSRLAYSRGGSLYSVRVDATELRVIGDPTPIQIGLPNEWLSASGSAYLASSASGLLAYVSGDASATEGELVIVERGGAARRLGDGTGERPRFSPDGKWIVAEDTGILWVYDMARAGARTRFARPGTNFNSMWSPDGKRIVSSSYANRGGPAQLLSAAVSDGADVRELAPSRRRRYASSYSTDGSTLAFVEMGPTSLDLYGLKADRTVVPLVVTDFNESQARFSPNGNWLAFTSEQSGEAEVYVQGYPVPGRPIKLSVGGGSEPVWNANGNELLYRKGEQIMSVSVAYVPDLTPGAPREIARIPGMADGDRESFSYDLSPDGRKIVAALRAPQAKIRELHVITGLGVLGKP